jgi:hypothetical protein
MKFQVLISIDPDHLINAYTNNTGISTEDCKLSIEQILEEELNWLNSSCIEVKEIKQIKD